MQTLSHYDTWASDLLGISVSNKIWLRKCWENQNSSKSYWEKQKKGTWYIIYDDQYRWDLLYNTIFSRYSYVFDFSMVVFLIYIRDGLTKKTKLPKTIFSWSLLLLYTIVLALCSPGYTWLSIFGKYVKDSMIKYITKYNQVNRQAN